MKTRQYLIKIIWCAVIILSAVGCSTSEEVFDEDYVPTEEDIVETLKKGLRCGSPWIAHQAC